MDNVAPLMTERLPPSLLATAKRVGEAARDAGVRPYVVGGTVRDLLLDVPASMDLDVSLLRATPPILDRLADALADALGGGVTSRSQFNATSLRAGGVHLDLVMTRAEEYPTPGSLPVVRPGTLAEDMARRDFSVNALAVSLEESTFGDLYDPHNGFADVRDRRLRVLHRASFRDDATRIIRAARYSARLSLELTDGTRAAILDSVGYLSSISAARVRKELERVFAEGDAAPTALRLLSEWGALGAVHPALRYVPEVWDRLHLEFGQSSVRDRIELGYGVMGATTPEADIPGLIQRLLPSSLSRRILREASGISSWIAEGRLARTSPGELAEMLDPKHEHAVVASAVASVGVARSSLMLYLDELRDLRPTLTGNDLIALGALRGPEVGRLLTAIRRARREGAVATRDDELSLAERLISGIDEA